MPRKDRKRFSSNLSQFIAVAAMLPPNRALPPPWAIQDVMHAPGMLDALEMAFVTRFPATRADVMAADAAGRCIADSPVLIALDGDVPVRQTATEHALFAALPSSGQLAWTPRQRRAGVLRDGTAPLVLASPLALYDLAYTCKLWLDGVADYEEADKRLGPPSRTSAASAFYALLPTAPPRPSLMPRTPLEVFVTAIQQTDADRVRRCRRCDTLFVATRKDARGCSLLCSDWIRVRRFRDRQQHQDLPSMPDEAPMPGEHKPRRKRRRAARHSSGHGET